MSANDPSLPRMPTTVRSTQCSLTPGRAPLALATADIGSRRRRAGRAQAASSAGACSTTPTNSWPGIPWKSAVALEQLQVGAADTGHADCESHIPQVAPGAVTSTRVTDSGRFPGRSPDRSPDRSPADPPTDPRPIPRPKMPGPINDKHFHPPDYRVKYHPPPVVRPAIIIVIAVAARVEEHAVRPRLPSSGRDTSSRAGASGC